MVAKIWMLCFGILLLVRTGVAQDCGLRHTLESTGFTPIDVNITDTPSCFVCPATAVSFSLNGQPLTSDPPDVVIDSSTVSIYNWSAVSPRLLTQNTIACTHGVGFTSTTFFFSLTPGPLVLRQVEPFYLEGGNNTNVACINFNQRSGYSVRDNNVEVWMNSAGEVVGGRTLNLTATRDNAGTYTCTVPTIPLISPVMFEVVIYFAPEVSTNILLPTKVDVGGMLELDCSYVGVPVADVTWTLNDSVLNSTVNSGISISTMTTGSSMTTTLTWTNVPVDAQGTYYCVLVNAAGSGSGSYTIQIATTPEPAANFSVTGTTNTTMSLTWEKQFDGLLTITGGVLEYFTGGSSSADMTVSGTTATLASLTPLTFYNVTLFVTNRLGRSAPVSLVQQTDSNFLEAPAVTLTAESSTELRLDWIAPASSPLVDTAAIWTLEFSQPNGSNLQRETVIASTFTRLFQNLSKGTEYRARVAGFNSKGMGVFSGYQTTETLVDTPSVPNNVVAVPLTSFAINVTWEVPTDMGGRAVTSYQVSLTDTASGELVYSETVNTQLFSFVNSKTFLEPSTMYQVSVAGINTAGLGASADQTVTTISLEQPQTVVVPVPVSMETNVSANVSWPFPGGNVMTFLLVITERRSQISMIFSVKGTELSRVVVGLRPSTTYDVVIITINDLGLSMASPLSSFNTERPPDPVITVNPLSGPYESGSDIVLTCTSPDGSRPIEWTKRDGPALEAPVFEINGVNLVSMLTIKDAQESNTGTYICTVGLTNTEVEIEEFTSTNISSINMGVSTSRFVMGIVLTFLLTVISYSVVLLLVLIVVRKYRSHSSRKVVNTLPSEEYYEYIAESPKTVTQQHTFEDKLKVESCAAYGVINEMKVMSPRESEETL